MGWRLFVSIVVLAILANLVLVPNPTAENNGLTIVASFTDIAIDLQKLACPGDHVYYIAPPGADPHSYSLKTSDIILLEHADIIVSTAHTAFEKEIHDKYAEGEFKGILIEIPSIPGIRVKINPETGRENLHMPIYDPYNLIVFIKNVSNTMAMLNPSCRSMYMAKANSIVQEIKTIINQTPRLNVTGVAETPYMQYAVEWTGIKVKYLLVKEHGLPATPSEVAGIEKGMDNGTIRVAVVSSPPASTTAKRLMGLAEKHGIPVIYVKPPFSNTSFIDKLSYISSQLSTLKINNAKKASWPSPPTLPLYPVSMLLGAILLALTLAYIWVKPK